MNNLTFDLFCLAMLGLGFFFALDPTLPDGRISQAIGRLTTGVIGLCLMFIGAGMIIFIRL